MELLKEWIQLKQVCDSCTKCGLHKGRKQAVLGTGDINSPLLLCAEGPGASEDETGVPFSGIAGKLLDKALLECGITREHVYLCNVVKCRAHGLSAYGNDANRQPTQEEINACNPFLLKQIELVKPKVILCVGSPAAKTIIKDDFKITRERGLFFKSKSGIPSIACLHPAFLLRQEKPELDRLFLQLVADITLAKRKVIELL